MDNQVTFGSLNLHTLVVSNSRLLDRTALSLIQGLNSSFPDLRELDLSRNKIGDKTCKALGQFLTTSYYLIKINLKWNQIGSNGAKYIFDGMIQANACKNLNLGYN
jgi:Ran GTPase-activating protein (RanGAP) involved in mRNA processing and transport